MPKILYEVDMCACDGKKEEKKTFCQTILSRIVVSFQIDKFEFDFKRN